MMRKVPTKMPNAELQKMWFQMLEDIEVSGISVPVLDFVPKDQRLPYIRLSEFNAIEQSGCCTFRVEIVVQIFTNYRGKLQGSVIANEVQSRIALMFWNSEEMHGESPILTGTGDAQTDEKDETIFTKILMYSQLIAIK